MKSDLCSKQQRIAGLAAPIRAVAGNHAIAGSTVIKEDDHPMTQVLDSIFQASMKVIALAMKLAIEAGRDSYRAGRMATRKYADPSSPLAGLI